MIAAFSILGRRLWASVAAVALCAAPLLAADSATVKATSVNLRAGAGTSHAVVGTLPRGSVVEILETAGDWHRVRTSDRKLEGWLSARLVERAAGPAAAAPVSAPPAALPVENRAGVSIEHRAASCLVAEQYAKLEACFAPADSVARAQVHFRGSATSLWYSVDMKPEGACFAALLPKPKRTTKEVQYFVFALDRQFAESRRPDGAPGTPFTPRVVTGKGECQDGTMLGALGRLPQIVVNVARDASGKLLDAGAAQILGAPAEISGFSAEGVVMGQPGAQSSSTSSTGAGGAAAGAGLGIPIIAVAGGAVAAGALVAVGAGGGGGDSNGTPSGPTGPSTASLTGTWNGAAAAGNGLIMRVIVPGGSCTFLWDVDASLVQTGNTLGGPSTINRRAITCNPSTPEVQEALTPLVPRIDNFTFAATLAPPNGITIPLGAINMTGTYTATTINATATDVMPDGTIEYKLHLSKR
jgi:SH3-like domain-containing protein